MTLIAGIFFITTIFLMVELFLLHQSLLGNFSNWHPFTRWGKEIASSFKFLEQKHSSKDSIEIRTSNNIEITEVVLEEAACFLSHRWKSSSVWLILEDGKSGVSDRDLRKHIELFRGTYADYFNSGNTQSLGLAQVNDRLSWGELKSSGIQAVIADTFLVSGSKLGICIIGSRNPALFSSDRIIDIKNICRTLGKELSTLEEIHELSNSVTKLTKETAFAKEMVKHVSHDLRSPLHTLRLVLSTLPGQGSDDDIVAAGLRSCDAAQSVVDSLLDLTKDSFDEKTLNFDDFHLSDVVKEVLPIFKPLASLKSISLNLILDSSNDYVTGDRRLIKRILTNLISNSIKYTQQGSVNISVGSSENQVILEVRDTGVGMSKEELNLLGKSEVRFKPDLAEGIGIGFTATKKMVEMMSAKLEICSESNRGTTVKVFFPSATKQTAIAV